MIPEFPLYALGQVNELFLAGKDIVKMLPRDLPGLAALISPP
jgi:hypothetical protein